MLSVSAVLTSKLFEKRLKLSLLLVHIITML